MFIKDKKGNWIVKDFLGSKPVKVYPNCREEQFIHSVDSVNGYCNPRSQTLSHNELGFLGFKMTGISINDPVIQTKDHHYFPIQITTVMGSPVRARNPELGIIEERRFQYSPKNVFFIQGHRRPNVEYILNKLIKLFVGEYPGNLQIDYGRYVFCLDNLSREFLNAFITRAKHGDGSVIDYTWIAPFQDLLEEKIEADMKREKPRKKVSLEEEREEESLVQDPLEDPTPRAARRFGETRKVSVKEVLRTERAKIHTGGGLIDAIKKVERATPNNKYYARNTFDFVNFQAPSPNKFSWETMDRDRLAEMQKDALEQLENLKKEEQQKEQF